MTRLSQCAHCNGFLPRAATACPHCKRRSLVKILGTTIGGGAIAMTLMACYGGPPCRVGAPGCPQAPAPSSMPAGDGGESTSK